MLLPQPLHHIILASHLPKVRHLDRGVSSSTGSSITINNFWIGGFTDEGLTPWGAHENVLTDTPLLPSTQRKMIIAFIMARDNAANFTVSSVTIGGVGGTELVDRGGATVITSSAIYAWVPSSLKGISNTNVTVTFSESIASGLMVAICEVSGLRSTGVIATGTAVAASGIISASLTNNTIDEAIAGGVILACSTLDTQLENYVDWFPATSLFAPWFNPIELTPFGGSLASPSAPFVGSCAYAVIPDVMLATAAISRGDLGVDWPTTSGREMAFVLLQ